ncbi:MAG: ATP-dependent nuclease [Nitrosotalea sp.]
MSLSTPVFVKRLRLQNFKSFEDFNISFDDLNVLVGINNSGKSSILLGVLVCFHFLADLIRERDHLDDTASRAAADVSFLHLPDVIDAWYNKRQRTLKSKIVAIIFTIELSNGINFEIHLRQFYGQPHIKIQNCTKPIARSDVLDILRSSPILVPGFVGALVQEELRTSQSVGRVISAGRHTEVLRNVLLQLKNTNSTRFNILNDLIKKYFNVELSKITFNDTTDEYLTTLYDDGNVELDVGLAGSGFLQMLQLLTFVLNQRSNIVLLDEPDAHLHPSLQKNLIQILTELGKKENIQFIISTHSKEIVANTEPRQIIHITTKSTEGKRISSYPELMDVMNNLGSLDNIDLVLLLETKRCLFIEGGDDKILRILSTTLGIDVFQGNKQVIPIRRNGENNYRYYDDLTVFRGFVGNELSAYSIIDKDTKTDDMIAKLIEKSLEKNVKTHVWKKHEIENYLIHPTLLERVFNNKITNLGRSDQVNDLMEIIEKCTEELKQDVTDRLAKDLFHWHNATDDHIDLITANRKAREFIETPSGLV